MVDLEGFVGVFLVYMNLSLSVATIATMVHSHLPTDKTSQSSVHLTFGKPGV